MSLHANACGMTISGTPGTGTVTFAGTATGALQSFNAGLGSSSVQVDVLFRDSTGAIKGVERNATYNGGSPGTLTRGTAETPSSAVSLVSTDTVWVAMPASTGNQLQRSMQMVTPGGRLTLESGVPVSTTDQTAKTSIFYTPYLHNGIVLWDGSDWVPITFSETTLALGTLTSGRPYDVFAYVSSGTLALELLAWTNDTTRATAVTLQDGRYCKSGDKTRLLLGSFYTTTTTTTADAETTRYVSNVYNRAFRRLRDSNSTAHTYTTATWREWNGGTGVTKLNFLCSLPTDNVAVSLSVNLQRASAGTAGYCNIGYDSTDGTTRLLTNLEAYVGGTGSFALAGSANINSPVGRHYATCIQFGESGVTYAAMTLFGEVAC